MTPLHYLALGAAGNGAFAAYGNALPYRR